jgi:hypothetical protein
MTGGLDSFIIVIPAKAGIQQKLARSAQHGSVLRDFLTGFRLSPE